jgi:hypothetical protein
MIESQDPIAEGLWNKDIVPESYSSPEKYQEHLFEQYKVFVNAADQVSTRRNVANTFFLTLHTIIVTVIGFVYEKGTSLTSRWVIVFPLVAILALCYTWWRLIKSYRQLNTAKYKIIGEYETKLPSSPYWSAEWKALGEGKNPKLYRPLTDIETWVPPIFAGLYIIGAVFVLIS